MKKRQSYIDTITPYINKPVIKVVTGMRRVGKSVLLALLQDELLARGIKPDHILSINMESLQFEWVQSYRELYDYVRDTFKGKSDACYLFIDEVQEIQNWEKAVSSLFSENIVDIYLTGSNAHLLSSELATLLSGRYIEFPVYPLTFGEFLMFRGKSADSPDREAEFEHYLKFGGLPGIHSLPLTEEIVFPYISSIFSTILLKDVVKRNLIRNVDLLERIARFVFDNCGNIFSANRVTAFLKSQKISLSVDTVQNYLSYLQAAFLIEKVSRYDVKGRRLLEIYEKYYMGDIGLRHGFIGYQRADIAGLLENIVYLELRHRGYSVTMGKWDDKEIDFIAQKEQEKRYIQVSYLMASLETEQREFSPLEIIQDHHPKLVLSMDKRQNRASENGVQWMNLIEFLLTPS